jgi:hypothetical protein
MLDIEYAAKKLTQDLKKYKAEFTLLTQNLEKIERASKEQTVLKSTDLHKVFLETKTRIRINKEIEISQKHLHKAESDFEKKLHTPFLKGNFSDQTLDRLKEAHENIKEIQDILGTNKVALDEVVDLGQKHHERIVALEEDVHKICLPDELSEATKINGRLIEYMERLCQETADFHLDASVNPIKAEEITTGMLQLYRTHQQSGRLLAQIQSNLHSTFPAVSRVALDMPTSPATPVAFDISLAVAAPAVEVVIPKPEI